MPVAPPPAGVSPWSELACCPGVLAPPWPRTNRQNLARTMLRTAPCPLVDLRAVVLHLSLPDAHVVLPKCAPSFDEDAVLSECMAVQLTICTALHMQRL